MWLEVDEDLPEHPKSLRLCAALMNPLGWAYVIKLWRWCVKFAPSGDLTSFSAEEIEYGLGWALDAGKLYAALKSAGFIEGTPDGRVVVHDWMDHQGRALKKMEKDARRKRISRRSRPKDVRRTSDGRRQDIRVTAQVPNLTKPNLTKPEETDSSPRPADRSSGTPIAELDFQTDGTPDHWAVTREQLAEWEALFPSLALVAECRAALAWIKAKPARRKTARGMPAFLVSWFSRSQNRGLAAAGGARRPEPTALQLAARERAERQQREAEARRNAPVAPMSELERAEVARMRMEVRRVAEAKGGSS